MPPEERFVCRFAAEPPQGPLPYGRWAETLQAEFMAACLKIDAEGEDLGEAGELAYYPDRTWSGRTYVPITTRSSTGFELYGYVSFTPGDEHDEPSDFYGWADFTDVTADDNPQWKIDLSDDVIGAWRAEGDREGDITLIWGLPLVRGAVAATAELDEEVLDQAPVQDGRFTLVAVDAVSGFGDDLYLEVKLWNRTLRPIASESLYAE